MSTNRINESTFNGFDISAAALHIIAMTLMLMDHLWATLLPAKECRKSGLSNFRLYGSRGILSHPELQKIYASDAAVCSAFGGSL